MSWFAFAHKHIKNKPLTWAKIEEKKKETYDEDKDEGEDEWDGPNQDDQVLSHIFIKHLHLTVFHR